MKNISRNRQANTIVCSIGRYRYLPILLCTPTTVNIPTNNSIKYRSYTRMTHCMYVCSTQKVLYPFVFSSTSHKTSRTLLTTSLEINHLTRRSSDSSFGLGFYFPSFFQAASTASGRGSYKIHDIVELLPLYDHATDSTSIGQNP